jgi:uncharacterized protein YhaN
MKFLRLDLRAFGPFTDAPPIDLSGGSRGLHLIQGPNEAGKSSALRAIRCLLFGYPTRLSDDHRHVYKDLRVGATLLDEQGTELAFLRRKGDVRTIRKLDDDGLVADETLAKFLGGLDGTKFDEFFAMDHAELVAGGLAILGGKGNLGSMLFAAGSGLARVDEVRKTLDDEMDELFKPTGRNPAINAALAQLREAREASEKAMLATTDWVELDATLDRERSRKEAIDGRIREVDAEKRRLERLRDALPVIARIDGVQASLAGFGNARVLSDGFADRRRDAVIARGAGSRGAQAAEEALEAVARDLEALGSRDLVLDEADAIRRVRDDLGLYRKSLEDRPIEQSRLARRQADALGLLLELRPGASLEEADSLRIPTALKGRVQALAEELPTLEAGLSTSEGEVARLLAASPGVDRQGVSAGALRLAEALAETIQQAQAQGDLEAQLASSLAELAKLEQQAAVDLQRLPLWSGTLEALEALAVPSKTTLLRFENGFREADETLARLALDLAKLEDEKARIDRQMEREQATGAVPTEEVLAARRTLRDDGWRRIRRAWLDREPIETPDRVADEFEAAVRSSDDLADRLRSEADAVAEQAQRRWRRRELADQVASEVEARDRSRKDKDVINQEWNDLWRSLGLDPLPPSEMKEWVADHRADLVRQAKILREKKLEHDRKASRIEQFRAEIGRDLEALGEPAVASRETLSALLAWAKSTVDRVNIGLRLDLARTTLAKAEAALLDGKSRWSATVGPLGLDADATPSEALAVIGRFDDLAAIVREVGELRARIDEQSRVESRFEASVRSLMERLGIESTKVSLESTALELDDRLKGALVVEARRDEALKRQTAERSKLEKARNAVDQADAALDVLLVEAGCDSTEGLVEAERVSDAIQERRKELRSLEGQLATLAGPIPVEKLREQADGVVPETLEARIDELAEQLAPLSAERDRLAQEIGRCLQRLDAMDGGPAAADAQQLVEERVAHLAIDVERYARLRLASAVLREAVERYRKEHQGPVLDRAGTLFASLTAGSFSGLKADLDDKGEPVLLGIRADGTTTLKVDGMSEGTADQLYLALRLASLQTYLDDHEPMPLVVDDILVNFDNARALAALQALAELSRRTQILFFTHHDHLVDLARATLPEDVLFVHHLDFPPVSIAVNGSNLEAGKPKRKKKAVVLEQE